MNGCIIPGTSIAVDFWKIRDHPFTSLTFFLTHLHGDHIVGLTSSWAYPVYCTEITATLLEKRYGLDPSILRPLEVNEAHIISSDESKQTTFTVTVIDAKHCPGAAMFLFEGDFGKILHTGDFRYHPRMFEPGSILSSHIAKIDVVYLDNTFCSPECVFPPREEARDEILRIIQEHPNHDILIGVRKLGKEELLVWLALQLDEWISVSGEMFEVADLMNLPQVLKVQDQSCRIRTVPFQMICKRNMLKWNTDWPTISILPTSIYTGIGGQPFCNQEHVFVVPYSDHSSYPELQEFVSKLKPASIVPIVSAKSKGPFKTCLKSRADMSVFDKYCSAKSNRRTFLSDKTQERLKNHSEIGKESRKPKLKKLRSSACLKKAVVKGVTFDSPDKESNEGKSLETANTHSADADTGVKVPKESDHGDMKQFVELEGDSIETNKSNQEQTEVMESQGFTPRMLYRDNKRARRHKSKSGSAIEAAESAMKHLDIPESQGFVYHSGSEEHQERDPKEDTKSSDQEASRSDSEVFAASDQVTVVYCEDMDRSDLKGHDNGAPAEKQDGSALEKDNSDTREKLLRTKQRSSVSESTSHTDVHPIPEEEHLDCSRDPEETQCPSDEDIFSSGKSAGSGEGDGDRPQQFTSVEGNTIAEDFKEQGLYPDVLIANPEDIQAESHCLNVDINEYNKLSLTDQDKQKVDSKDVDRSVQSSKQNVKQKNNDQVQEENCSLNKHDLKQQNESPIKKNQLLNEHNQSDQHKRALRNKNSSNSVSPRGGKKSKYFSKPEAVVDLTDNVLEVQNQKKLDFFFRRKRSEQGPRKLSLRKANNSQVFCEQNGGTSPQTPAENSGQDHPKRKATKRKNVENDGCRVCGNQLENRKTCPCDSFTSMKRRKCRSEQHFGGGMALSLSVKPLRSFTDQEIRQKSRTDTILCLQGWLDRHK